MGLPCFGGNNTIGYKMIAIVIKVNDTITSGSKAGINAQYTANFLFGHKKTGAIGSGLAS